ncbi:MAG TPA: hypothetical protein VFK78_09400 [Gemmatimonadales bacterium]|nr:hypothetical protein [Gemmatimonadales bacterium]
MHIELTEMLRCVKPHEENFLVMSTGEMRGRLVRTGVLGCPVCHAEYPILKGLVDFTGHGRRETAPGARSQSPIPVSRLPLPDVQALLDLSGPGGYIVLVGSAARYGAGLSDLMAGVHFVGVNPPEGVEELSTLSLVRSVAVIPVRQAIARGVVVGADSVKEPWTGEAVRVLLRGRRYVQEGGTSGPAGVTQLAASENAWVGEKQ